MSLSISIVTAVCGAVDVTQRWFAETVGSCEGEAQVCIGFNGCTEGEINTIMAADKDRSGGLAFSVSETPQGSAHALNVAAELATGHTLAILHNDLLVHHPGWDTALEYFFQSHPEAGVVGFAGAKGLGRADIYRSPYELTQLARFDVWTSLEDWEAHGQQAVEPVKVAVLDGLAICLRKSLWATLGGFDEGIGPHHMYDIDLSLRALEAGFINYVIPITARHLSGATANASRYQQQFGPDQDVHRHAHENFYAKYFNRLPVRV